MLRIDGEVERPAEFTFDDLSAIDSEHQIADVSRVEPSRKGTAVSLAALLDLVRAKTSAKYLGLHSSKDDFHASIPLDPVRDRGMLIYGLDGDPLPEKAGGPVRFFIRDYAACHSDDIDECANVKFVQHIELTRERGFDNRPADDEQHEELHRQSPPT